MAFSSNSSMINLIFVFIVMLFGIIFPCKVVNGCSFGCINHCPVGFDACCTLFCVYDSDSCYVSCMTGNYGA